METKSIPQPLQNTLNSLTSIQRNTSKVSNEVAEIATEMRQDKDNDGDMLASTVNLSGESLKLSAASAAKNIAKQQPIENIHQAQKALLELVNSFQNNPSQAIGSQSGVPSRVVKELLG